MVVLTAGQLTTLRSHPQGMKFYLCCHVPRIMVYCQVNGTVVRGARTIPYNNAGWQPNPSGGNYTFSDVQSNVTLYVGSALYGTELGRVRVRSMDATNIYLAENEHIPWADNLYLEIGDIHEPWSIFPRVVPNAAGDDVDIWQDYDINYVSQADTCRPVPIMGGPAVGFLSGSPARFTAHFHGSQSYGLDGATIASYAWKFPGGTPATSTAADPGDVYWSVSGTYMVQLTITDSNGKIAAGYRMVRVYAGREVSTGVDAPYCEFEVSGLEGSWDDGGWSAAFTVRDRWGRIGPTYFRDNAEVILFAEGQVPSGSTLPIPGNDALRSNILYRGWIVGESIQKNPSTNEVSFDTTGICGRMELMEEFSNTFEVPASGGAASKWYELEHMTVDLAVMSNLRWRSTILELTDVFMTGLTTKKIMREDFQEGNLYNQCQTLMDAIVGRICGDKLSTIYMRVDPQVLPTGAERNALDTVFTLQDSDWGRDAVSIERIVLDSVSQIDLAGVYHDGGADPEVNAHPILALAPGTCPRYEGNYERVDGLCVESQSQANQLAGDILDWRNNPFPNITVPMSGAWTPLDVAPPSWILWTIPSTWTKRQIYWTAARFIPRAVEIEIDSQTLVTQVNITLEREADGADGITGIYPPTEATEATGPGGGNGETPGLPDTPGNGGGVAGSWRKHVLVSSSLGPYYTETFVEGDGPGGVPTWRNIIGGMGTDINTLCLAFHPTNPELEHYCCTPNTIYRRHPAVSDDWNAILTASAAAAVCGWPGDPASANPAFSTIQTNSGAPSHLYACLWIGPSYGIGVNQPAVYFCKSTDEGGSWSYYRMNNSLFRYGSASTELQNQNIEPFSDLYVSIGDSWAGASLFRSLDQGLSWQYIAGSRDSYSTTEYYQGHLDGLVFKHKYVSGQNQVFRSVDHGDTWTALNIFIASNAPGKHWMNEQLAIPGLMQCVAASNFYYSPDDGDTVELTTGTLAGPWAIELVPDAVDKLYLFKNGGISGNPHQIFASADRTVTVYPKCGAHANISGTGGGDSIPYDAQVTDCTPIWTLE